MSSEQTDNPKSEFAGLEDKDTMNKLAHASDPTDRETQYIVDKIKNLELDSSTTSTTLTTSIKEVLSEVEKRTSFHYIDFLAEFGATELFLISGDGLLSWILDLHHIDHHSGGQSLPILWTVEKFLSDLIARNGTFRIFFFKDEQMEAAWTGSKGLMRKLLIAHLEKNTTTSVDSVDLPWVNPKSWEDYTSRYQPAFLLLNLSQRQREDCDNDFLEIVQYGVFSTQQKENVLDIDELSFDGTKILAFSGDRSEVLRDRLGGLGPQLLRYMQSRTVENVKKGDVNWIEENSLRNTLSLTALRNLLQGQVTNEDVWLAQAFTQYLQVLESLSLSQRSHKISTELSGSEEWKRLSQFVKRVAGEIARIVDGKIAEISDDTFVDLIDGRLFCVTAVLWDGVVDGKFWEKVSQGLTLPQAQPIQLSKYQKMISPVQDNSSSEPIRITLSNSLLHKVIPDLFKSRFVDVDNSDVDAPVDEQTAARLSEDSLKYFQYEKKPEAEMKKWKQMKVAQRQEAALTKYAANLLVDSPAKRVVLAQEDTNIERQRKIRVALESLEEKKEAEVEEKAGKKEKKEKKVVVKKKDQMIQANKQKKHSAAQTSHTTKLENDNAQLKKLIKDGKHSSNEAKKLVASIEKFAVQCFREEQHAVGVDAVLAVLDYWTNMTNKEDGKSEKVMENLFCGLQLALRSAPADAMSPAQKTQIMKTAVLLGFPDFISDLEKHLDTKNSGVKPLKITTKRDTSAIRYQLLNVSYNLKRPLGKAQDNRVSFMPDDWQKRLLDVVDAEESALICAATSSGKTFISFYAMESILRLDSNSVVVFVAPTKALVNQMEAEVSARFSKTYRSTGKFLCGVFTRDYKKNLDNCQVLITVPACLEILMLNPAKLNWTKTIRYVVLDEVHCLGQENGEVWQRLLMTINCPFLALSATIGNLDQLYGWMSGISQSKGKKLHLVHYKERFNYLKMSYVDSKGENQGLNPLFALNLKAVKQEKQLPDIKLLPEDCVQSLEILKGVPGIESELRELQPEAFFSHLKEQKTWNISMKDASAYEDAIKKLFLRCLLEKPTETEAALQKHDPGMKTHDCRSEEDVFKILDELKAKELLPTIVFHLSRAGCEALALALTKKLSDAEMEYRRQKGTQGQIDKLTEAIERESVRAKRDRDIIESANSEGKAIPPDVENRQKNLTDMQNKLNLLAKVDKKYGFFPRNISVTMEDIKEHHKWADPNDPLVQGLLRGIGVHHGGVDKGYRKAVERMFRLKQLAVIFGTATLSLGLNMPCKCVVMCRDSILINGVQFRQMAGRAGRRGFDLEGRVILAGLPASKIKRLLANRLPDIISSSPVTPTSALRLMVSHAINRADPQVASVAKTFISHPLFFNNANNQVGLEKEIVTGSHLLLSVEYLLREGVIENNGMPAGVGALAYHLYWLEPNNFWLVALLRSGLFDDLTARTARDPDQVLRLAEVLSNLFCRIPLHKSQTSESGPSLVVLPPLPEDFQRHLQEHEERLKGYSRDFAAWFVKKFGESIGHDNVMPLSSIKLNPSATLSPLAEKVKSVSGTPSYVSNFVGVSGLEPERSDLTEICNTIRSGVPIERSILPGIDAQSRFNSYIVDVLRHGDRKAIVLHNRVRPEVLYESLREFGLILTILSVEMRRRAESTTQNVTAAAATATLFETLTVRFKQTFNSTFEVNK
ncbi:hypothetical protein PROFUN_00540 [Planoprotostelium fungivorum]|uniref:DEAD/DEAH box helicase n=1 Tax=Planoprotostelium fungivorum TaxID=1890364 RepID=A0A2P6N154_9EUKA|nr:hypothetical protein PROFUN_00540 [Planoprotostelium fungivorum]